MRGLALRLSPELFGCIEVGRVRRQEVQFDVRTVGVHPGERCLVIRGPVDDHVHPLAARLVVPHDTLQEDDEAVSVELVFLEPEVELRLLPVNGDRSVDFAAASYRLASDFPADASPKPRVRYRARLLEDTLVFEEDDPALVRRFFLTPGRTCRSQRSCAV